MKNFLMSVVLVFSMFCCGQVNADWSGPFDPDWWFPGTLINSSPTNVIVHGEDGNGDPIYVVVPPGQSAGGGLSLGCGVWDADFVFVRGNWYKVDGFNVIEVPTIPDPNPPYQDPSFPVIVAPVIAGPPVYHDSLILTPLTPVVSPIPPQYDPLPWWLANIPGILPPSPPGP